MISPSLTARPPLRWRLALGAIAVMLLSAPSAVEAQVVQGVEQGARAGNKAAGPVGGVLGGTKSGQAPATSDTRQGGSKSAKAAKGAKATKQQAVLTQEQGEPQLTADQIAANSDANIER